MMKNDGFAVGSARVAAQMEYGRGDPVNRRWLAAMTGPRSGKQRSWLHCSSKNIHFTGILRVRGAHFGTIAITCSPSSLQKVLRHQ